MVNVKDSDPGASRIDTKRTENNANFICPQGGKMRFMRSRMDKFQTSANPHSKETNWKLLLLECFRGRWWVSSLGRVVRKGFLSRNCTSGCAIMCMRLWLLEKGHTTYVIWYVWFIEQLLCIIRTTIVATISKVSSAMSLEHNIHSLPEKLTKINLSSRIYLYI